MLAGVRVLSTSVSLASTFSTVTPAPTSCLAVHAYFVDDPGDFVLENPGEGIDTVLSSAHFRLPENVENLVLRATAAASAPHSVGQPRRPTCLIDD